VVPEVGLEPT